MASTMAKQPTRSNQRTAPPGRLLRKKWPCTGAALFMVGGVMATAQAAESSEGMGLRNLTSATITQLYASQVGQNTFGQDQVALIPGHAVAHDKILKLTDTAPGHYELRIATTRGAFVGSATSR